ncbi:glutathione S-transferase family protein [Aliagarivorans marinus]|uniref:glutathione S-transferase family protein n=1 Tax=Aliagarivorans marinus TaxID=561965 RepID=UPI000479C6BE|nr:glutathione S-transferase family protein [Aliagarivorans marinus]
MLKFYFNPGPNPMKVALFLAETNLPFELVAVDTRKGEQHTPEYRAINPNGKTPAIMDDGQRVFDSTAILMYLSEKSGKLGGEPNDRAELLSWMMFIASGLGPFSGQSVHFLHKAPEEIPYAQNRYLRETQRHYEVLDAHLEGRDFIVGNEYTIADISAWGWVDRSRFALDDDELVPYPNVKRWFEQIDSRPAVAKAHSIGSKLTFKSTMDDEAQRALYPSNFAKEQRGK